MLPSEIGPSLYKANNQKLKALLEVNDKHRYIPWKQGPELDMGDTQPHVSFKPVEFLCSKEATNLIKLTEP